MGGGGWGRNHAATDLSCENTRYRTAPSVRAASKTIFCVQGDDDPVRPKKIFRAPLQTRSDEQFLLEREGRVKTKFKLASPKTSAGRTRKANGQAHGHADGAKKKRVKESWESVRKG